METDHSVATMPSRSPGLLGDALEPLWFRTALGHQAIPAVLDHEEGRVAYRTWGQGDHLVVLIHGRSANSRWWDHIAPLLVDAEIGIRVVAVDLPGHGDSDWRATYTIGAWARDVAQLIEAERGQHDPVVVGHSMGSSVALVLASLGLVPLAGMVAIDPPIGIPHAQNGQPAPGPRRYPTRSVAEARFRLVPADPASWGYIERHLAAHAVRRRPDGDWTWKTDPLAMAPALVLAEDLAPFEAPLLVVRAERGLATVDSTRKVLERARGEVEAVIIPDSGHHILTDQPLALVSLLGPQLTRWWPAGETSTIS